VRSETRDVYNALVKMDTEVDHARAGDAFVAS